MKNKLTNDDFAAIFADEMRRSGFSRLEIDSIITRSLKRMSKLEKLSKSLNPIRFLDKHQDSLFVFVVVSTLLLTFKMLISAL